jgi:predicted MFS family arabinose efflux permease
MCSHFPPQLGLLNGIYGGLGQSIGSLIGGDMVRHGGISSAFFKCAAVDGVLLVAFALVQMLLKKPAKQLETDVGGAGNSANTVEQLK